MEHPADIEQQLKETRRAAVPSGGAGGYYLRKDSATDYDYAWHPLDLDEVTVGIAIADLGPAATLDGTEAVAVVQMGVTVQTTTGAIADLTPIAVTFSYPGALDADVESPPWYPPVAVTFTLIRISVTDPGGVSVNTVISLLIGGVEFAQYTLLAELATDTFAISCPVLTSEPVTIETITVGTDEDLSVQLYGFPT